MTTTMIPPPPRHERDTEPPDNPRESSAPPADLGPTGIALRLLALEEKVSETHAETKGISKAFHDIRNAVLVMSDSYERLAADMEILRRDAIEQRKDRARLLEDVDALKRSAIAHEGKTQ